MSQISNRLTLLRSAIRKEHLQNYMQSSRERLMRENDEAFLREVSGRPNEALTREQLMVVIEMANDDLPYALIMVGNLVIDRFMGPAQLQAIDWRMGNSEYWPWVVHTFAEVGFCTPQMYNLCLRRIIARRSSFSLQHALEVLLICFKLTPQAIETIKQNQELLLALSNRVMENEEKSPQLALSIFSTLTSQDESFPSLIVQCLGVARTEQMLLQGLMKTQAGLRALACQIANNFLMSGVWLERVCLRILQGALGEKQKVRLESSYYLKALVEVLSEDQLFMAIKRTRLMQVLKTYSKPSLSRLGSEIAENALRSLAVIRSRFGRSCMPQREMAAIHAEKLLDESEMQTVYEEESARMIE